MNTGNGSVTRALLTAVCLAATGCTVTDYRTLVTIADARTQPATRVDLGEPGDSVGDTVLFDQPLLDEAGAAIGNNSGVCIRSRVAHSYQCQWTLTFDDGLPGDNRRPAAAPQLGGGDRSDLVGLRVATGVAP